MAAKYRKQTEVITNLREQIFILKNNITESSADKMRKERLLETVKRKRDLEAKRAVDLEQQLVDVKERECRLKNRIKLSSDQVAKLNETLNSKTCEYDQHIAEYKQELLSKDCTLEKLKRELQNSETVIANLRIQILKLKEAEQQRSEDHDKASVALVDHQKRCETISKEYQIMEQENHRKWKKERSHLEEDFQKRTLSLELQCAEKDDMLKRKELAFDEFRVKQESVLTGMKADMQDLRAELSNQIKVNGKLKQTYEDLRVGTDLKIRSLERRMECVGKSNLLMLSNSNDIKRIEQILEIGCSETDVTFKRERSPRTPMPSIRNPESMSFARKPIMMNLEPRGSTVTVQNSPAFSRSLRSTLHRKRTFQEDKPMTGNSKKRRHAIDCTPDGQNRDESHVQVYDPTYYQCALM